MFNIIIIVFIYIINNINSYFKKDRFSEAEIALNFKSNFSNSLIILPSQINNNFQNISIDLLNNINYYINNNNKNLNKQITKFNNISLGFKYNNFNITNFPFKEISSAKINKHLPTISLAHFYEDISNSLTHQLFYMKKISTLQFSILFSYPDYGTLSFGETSNFIRDMNKKVFKHTCKVPLSEKNNVMWSCFLSGIFFGKFFETNEKDDYIINKNLSRAAKINKNVYFNPNNNFIIVPYEIILYLKENYFKENINKNFCRLENKEKMFKFICRKFIQEKLEFIHFVFEDEKDFFINPKNLFDEENYFKIICVEGNSKIIFGYPFLRQYVNIFNYENDTITFFGIQNKIYIKKIDFDKEIIIKDFLNDKQTKLNEYESKNNLFKIEIIIILILVIFFIIYLIFKKENKNNFNQKLLNNIELKEN